ncbi:MAG TPA: alanine-zipper protein [Solirubrobacterales bacterium]|nr:alanine-zipper protein [Solirubrobacterales bacterium]
MRRRYVIVATAGLLALGIVTPVLGHPGAGQALDRAKKAKKIAKSARDSANDALALAQQAHTLAQQADQGAQRANGRLDQQRVVSAQEPSLVTSTAAIGSYDALGGPSVTVTVPDSGLIEVWAQVDIKDDDGGAVGLYEDGQKVPGVSEDAFCGDDTALIEMDGGGPGDVETFSTPPIPNLSLGCTNAGAPSSVILQRPTGSHTYELRYSECQCGAGESEFSNRVLRIAPRP